MKRLLSSLTSKTGGHSQGQTFIIIAAGFLALVAFVGLAVDLGIVFLSYAKLGRGVDAAALAAASQIREGRTLAEMQEAAENALAVNGVNYTSVVLEMCDYAHPDPNSQLCTEPYPKKLVRVTVSATTPLAFLRVLGFNDISLTASAISEAASMDVVLVIDISESMAWDKPIGDPLRDPNYCNDTSTFPGSEDGVNERSPFPGGTPGECHPFEEVKNAAGEFILRILDKDADEEEDRLAIVTFGNGWSSDEDLGTFVRTVGDGTGWTSDRDEAMNVVKNLKVFSPNYCNNPDGSINQYWGPCRQYAPFTPNPEDPNNFVGKMYCFSCGDHPSGFDGSTKTSTNIGGGLLMAGNMFAAGTREDALWIVVLLTDGMANATNADSSDDVHDFSTYPIGFCPNEWVMPLCQDEDVTTRHDKTADPDHYDADDYARDMADFVGCYPTQQSAACGSTQGQGAVIFTIGLGNGVLDTINEVNGKPYGAALLRYIAAVGDDGDADTDLCEHYWNNPSEWEEWCGNYYFSPEGDQLSAVFQDIASRIFTRLNR